MRPVRKQIADILRHVDDPELGINIVDLGLVYDLQFVDDRLSIERKDVQSRRRWQAPKSNSYRLGWRSERRL
jgi:metal-sulfur cluster biosynthetic enzyme